MKLSTKTMLIISAVVVLAMTALSIYVSTQLPTGEPVCTHWDAAGDCNGWGNKFVGLFLMPLITAGIAVLFLFIPRIEPRAANIAQSATALMVIWGVMLAFFAIMHAAISFELLGRDARIDVLMPMIVGAMFVAIGAVMGRMRSNYLMGIRTPWTLASELSWNKTHQLGGILFMAEGLFLIVSSLIMSSSAWVNVMLGGIFGLVLVLFVYSYIVWKNDPDRKETVK